MTSTPPAFSTDDESAVRALVSEFANTWNRHDMKAMHELDTGDVEWINITGNYWRGRPPSTKAAIRFIERIFAKTSMTVEETAIRPIAPNVAVAVATMTFGPVITPTGQKVPEIKRRGSFTTVKSEGICLQRERRRPATRQGEHAPARPCARGTATAPTTPHFGISEVSARGRGARSCRPRHPARCPSTTMPPDRHVARALGECIS
jgi:uncharacterized protein (TIGR02246 family)